MVYGALSPSSSQKRLEAISIPLEHCHERCEFQNRSRSSPIRVGRPLPMEMSIMMNLNSTRPRRSKKR
jgi:hypothetical protein